MTKGNRQRPGAFSFFGGAMFRRNAFLALVASLAFSGGALALGPGAHRVAFAAVVCDPVIDPADSDDLVLQQLPGVDDGPGVLVPTFIEDTDCPPTPSPTPSPTDTPSPTATPSATPQQTSTPSPSPTSSVLAASASPTPTSSPVPVSVVAGAAATPNAGADFFFYLIAGGSLASFGAALLAASRRRDEDQ